MTTPFILADYLMDVKGMIEDDVGIISVFDWFNGDGMGLMEDVSVTITLDHVWRCLMVRGNWRISQSNILEGIMTRN
ncbi:hypothetical protein L3X38_011052 [Prunus dulcis]|uniref:Uncharacterized protein n=1 Tax=Prunus dulcis TaxID=3755 RepID=A0AAD4ZF09_PRUDU|nr:hypothetical protein L3X38_011052 [Prunus dulcis]